MLPSVPISYALPLWAPSNTLPSHFSPETALKVPNMNNTCVSLVTLQCILISILMRCLYERQQHIAVTFFTISPEVALKVPKRVANRREILLKINIWPLASSLVYFGQYSHSMLFLRLLARLYSESWRKQTHFQISFSLKMNCAGLT